MKSLKAKLKNTVISTVMVCATLFTGCTTMTSKKDNSEDNHYLLEEVLEPVGKSVEWIKDVTSSNPEEYDDFNCSKRIEEANERIQKRRGRKVKPIVDDPNVIIPESFLNDDGTLKSDEEIDKIQHFGLSNRKRNFFSLHI